MSGVRIPRCLHLDKVLQEFHIIKDSGMPSDALKIPAYVKSLELYKSYGLQYSRNRSCEKPL